MKKWEIIGKSKIKDQRSKIDEIIKVLLENRGLKTKKDIEEFLNPKLEDVTVENIGIDKKQLARAIKRIKVAIENKEQIVVFGDYDVDGICGTAILWEALRDLRASTMPYIPHRVEEGYGLSIKGIENLKTQYPTVKLIITVDNGIVANEAVEFAKKEGIDVIITDHHVSSKTLPKAYAIVHTTKLCGAGVAWMLVREIENRRLLVSLRSGKIENSNGRWKMEDRKYLELVALATVADLVPLTGANRTLLKLGLEELRTTKRVGILALCQEAVINQTEIKTHEIGRIIAPRLNAMGRLEYAMESLRLLCTKNTQRAKELAQKLGATNRERQLLTEETVLHAKQQVIINNLQLAKLLFIGHETYQQGVIGLVAGKLVEEFYRPSIVIAKGDTYSKASARSISGFNIIEFIRSASDLLVDAGGHPMAAGFTIETEKLVLLEKKLHQSAKGLLTEEMFKRTIKIDCEIPFSIINEHLYETIQKLSPFGMANPEPTFASKSITIEDMRFVGKGNKHLKLRVASGNIIKEAIAFGMGEVASELHMGQTVRIAYTLDENRWNGRRKLQLKIKDIKNN